MKNILLVLTICFASSATAQDAFLGGIGSINRAPHLGLSYMLLHDNAGFAIDAGFTLLTAPLVEPTAKEVGDVYITRDEIKLPMYVTDAFQIAAMPVFRADRFFGGIGVSYYDYTEKWYRVHQNTGEVAHSVTDDRKKRGLTPIYRIGGFPLEWFGIAYSYGIYRGSTAEMYFRF